MSNLISMKSRVTNMRVELVHYHSIDGACTGSNLLYKVDGQNRSSRVSWIADASVETARLERVLVRTKK